MRRGFTLVECMVAGAVFALMTLALFEGIIVATRIAHENADTLAAEAVVWDAVWKRFNENFDKLRSGTVEETLDESAAPQLAGYDTPPVLRVTVGPTDETGFCRSAADMVKISAGIEWGNHSARRTYTDAKVIRSRSERSNE